MLNLINLQSSDTVVGRLRIEGAGVDPTLARLRASSLLNNSSLQSAQISTAAIVFIRRFRDPRPGVLRLDQSGRHLPAVWDEALRETLHRLARGAARPVLGAVPVGAEAVVFLDRSELLACLAADWCEGSLAMRWWWQSLLREGNVSQLVKQFWRENPEYIPTALQHLANMNRAVEFVGSLSEAEARDLVQRVVRRFALHSLLPVLDHSLPEVSPSTLPEELPDLRLPVPSAPREIESARVSTRAPWHPWVPESEAPRLRPEQQRFLGIALMIQREPSRARTQSFAREVEFWQRQTRLRSATAAELQPEFEPARRPLVTQPNEARPQPGEPSAESADYLNTEVAASSRPVGQPKRSRPIHAEQYESRVEPLADLVEEVPTSLSVATKQQSKAPALSDLEDAGSSDTELHRPPQRVLPTITDSNDAHQSELLELESPARFLDEIELTTIDDLAGHRPEQQEAPMATVVESELVSAIEIDTELGGLFYLINLALYLDLYGDFTNPAEPGLQLSIWDFVALVGAELTEDHIHDDPIWSLLATLAGRDKDDQPGSDFKPPDDWRLAPQWLTPFTTEKPCSWSTEAGRLRLLHPDGFLVLDLPLESGDPSSQLQREIKSYRNLLTRRIGHVGRIEPMEPIRIWLSRLIPYVQARLRRALGLGPREDPGVVLCRSHSRVRATATHVDVFFALAELPVEVRLAGLDRDPGWVPSAGRFIAFHYD